MWKSSEFCDFISSWECDHDPNFLSTYSVVQSPDEWNITDESVDHTNSSFITCSRNEHPSALEISCACKPHHGVSIIGLEVRSQVQTVELYSDTDGYLQTIKGRKEEDGMFCCQAKLEKPVDHLNLKFMGLGQKSSVRLFRLHFVVIQHLEPGVRDGSTGMVNMSKVRGFLHSMGDSAPEGGTKLLQAVEEYQQTQMSQFWRLSSALSSGPDSSSVLSSLLAVVNRSHGTEPSNQKTPNDQQKIKAPDPEPGGPLAAMLKSMSGGQGDSGGGGMFDMLQNICGKVSKMRVAEHTAETGAENVQTDAPEPRVMTEPEIGASTGSAETASSKVTGVDLEMLQTSIEQTVSKMLQASEDKVMKQIDCRLDAMETRLNKKLDSLIQLFQKTDLSLLESDAGI